MTHNLRVGGSSPSGSTKNYKPSVSPTAFIFGGTKTQVFTSRFCAAKALHSKPQVFFTSSPNSGEDLRVKSLHFITLVKRSAPLPVKLPPPAGRCAAFYSAPAVLNKYFPLRCKYEARSFHCVCREK